MQSSYNVIKNTCVMDQGNVAIITNININNNNNNKLNAGLETEKKVVATEAAAEANETVMNAKALAADISLRAEAQAEEILARARENAETIKSQAYDLGYKNGEENGYEEAYNSTLRAAEADAAVIINNANEILFNAKLEYEDYIQEKKDEIIKLTINMAEAVLKKELSLDCGLDEMILEVIRDSRNSEMFIIRTRSLYIEDIKTKSVYWKESLGLKAEIFVVADENVGEGNAVIEKSNGKIEIGIGSGMEGIRQALL